MEFSLHFIYDVHHCTLRAFKFISLLVVYKVQFSFYIVVFFSPRAAVAAAPTKLCVVRCVFMYLNCDCENLLLHFFSHVCCRLAVSSSSTCVAAFLGQVALTKEVSTSMFVF